MGFPPRRLLIRVIFATIIVLLTLSAGVLSFGYEEPSLNAGTIESPANSTTVVSSQGWHSLGRTLPSRPARIVAFGPNGSVKWRYDGPENTTNWFYDVDQLSNGNLLIVSPDTNGSVVAEYNPRNRTLLWSHRFSLSDIHDVDLINGDELLVAGINYDTGETSNDSVFIYNRTQNQVTWRWSFKNHYRDSIAGGIGEKDWSHVNDIDKVGEGEFLVSPRDFDQVIRINRSTKNIDLRLGRDEKHDTLYEQHNPDYLEGPNGTPTVLVADSENDRVVEYRRTSGPPGNGTWKRTWSVSGGLNWARDADRLPSGNTLITDSANSRAIEVTPNGTVVWEVYSPWMTYESERLRSETNASGPNRSLSGSRGPTMAQRGVTGSYEISGASAVGTTGIPTLETMAESIPGWLPLSGTIQWVIVRWYHLVPWFTPRWLPTPAATLLGLALLVGLGWGLGETLSERGRGQRCARGMLARLRQQRTEND